MRRFYSPWVAVGIVSILSCSLVNAPDEVVPAPAGTGGAAGSGGAGGDNAGGGGAGAVCRNGVLEDGEDCDDGNGDTGDACSPDCKITEFEVEIDPSIGNEWPGIGLSGVDGVDGAKGFFVIWRYLGPTQEIRGRAFKANGQRVTQPPVKLSTGALPSKARIGTNLTGRSLVAWGDGSAKNTVHYRIVEPDGKPLGPGDEEIPFSQTDALPSVGSNSSGASCLMWMDEGAAVDQEKEVRVRCFDENGSNMATSTQVLSTTTSFGYPGIWGVKDGFVASWNSQDGKLASLSLDSLGVPVGAPFSLAANANANRSPFGAYVGPDLQFIAVFEQDIDFNGNVRPRITKRLFDSPGMSKELEGLASMKHTTQRDSRLAHHTNGRFVIVWTNDDQVDPVDACNIEARIFAPDGTPIGPEFTVNQKTEGCQSWPGVAVNSDGDAMFVWDNAMTTAPFHISGIIHPRLLSSK